MKQVLPNFEEDKYSKYVEDKKKGLYYDKSEKKWYNDFNLVGAIGELWTAYKKFFEYNGYEVWTIILQRKSKACFFQNV